MQDQAVQRHNQHTITSTRMKTCARRQMRLQHVVITLAARSTAAILIPSTKPFKAVVVMAAGTKPMARTSTGFS